MLKLGASLLLIPLSMIQCSSHIMKEANVINKAENSTSPSPSPIAKCRLEDFTQSAAEHIINEIKQPFLVKEIKGKILNSTGDGWTKEIRVLLEMRGTKDGHRRKTYADEKGNFVIRHIPDGEYCFKATVLGWQSVMGIIIVSNKADPKNAIVLEMRWGV